MSNLRLLDTFSGIGGFSYAAEHIVGGFETVAFVEREPFCQRILAHHWPNVPIYDDIKTFNPKPYSADVICGGFPCQDISTAGKQAGIKQGTRSGLFYELMRVVCLVRPQFVVLENVAAILTNGLDTVLGELAEAGFDAEWACIPASAVGACHQRDRWWLVAYPSRADRTRWPEGLGRRLSSESDAGAGRLPQGSWGADANAADTTSTGARQHEPHPRRQRDGESLLANGRADQEIPRPTSDAKSSGRRARQGSDAPNPHNQRQQEQLTAAIADQQRRPGWHDAPRRLNPDWRGYVSEPVLCRGDDGLSNRVDRLKALGNAVVPQVAAIPLQRVLDLANAA